MAGWARTGEAAICAPNGAARMSQFAVHVSKIRGIWLTVARRDAPLASRACNG